MTESERSDARNHVLLGFLTLLNVLNFVDRQLLASFANFIVPDLGLTNTQFGLLTGLAFLIFYAVMGLFMGALADLVHRPRLIAISLALWSGLTAVSGAARGFVSLAIPRMFIGIGESALTPTALSLLADRFPARRLGFAAGVYYMGVPLGVGMSLLVAGYLGPAIGWRNCFYLLGGLGTTMAMVALAIRETRPYRRVAVAGSDQNTVPPPPFLTLMATLVHALRTCPALSLTITGGVTFHFILGATAFDQLWFVQERGFDRAHIAQLTGWIGMGAGVLGNLFGGFGSDLWLKRTGQGRPTFLFWVTLILAPILITYRLVSPESPWFSLGIFCSFFLLGSFYGPTFSTVQELVPPQIRGTVVAFYILMLSIVGLGFGITAGGLLVDFLISRDADQPYTTMLLGFTFLSLLAIPLFYAAGKRFTTDRARLFALETEEGEEGTG